MSDAPRHYLAFSPVWFEKHQRLLLWLLNSRLTKQWFRWVLRIRVHDCPLDVIIIEIFPNRFSFGDRYFEKNDKWYIERKTDFRTHDKFSKRLYYAFRPLWWMLHVWDSLFAERLFPQLSFGFDTLTAYPDANPETSTVDGIVGWQDGASPKNWANIIIATGNVVFDSSLSGGIFVAQNYPGSPSFFVTLRRSIYLFNTTTLAGNVVISAAVLSIFGSAKVDTLGVAPDLDIYTSNPASNTALVAADYNRLGDISQTGSPIAYASWSIVAYNDFTLNGVGIANVSKTGISKFGARNANYDVAAVAPIGTDNSSASISGYYADQTGTTNDPKLVVTYSRVTIHQFNQSQSNIKKIPKMTGY